MDITPKQRKIVKEKIKGKTDKQIGVMVYPNAQPESARVQVSTQLHKPNVAQYYEQSKLQALKEHNITWSRIIKPISEGLSASLTVRDKEGNILAEIPDLNTQMRASKLAQDLVRVKDELDPQPIINQLPNVDEIQLIRLMKNPQQKD